LIRQDISTAAVGPQLLIRQALIV